MFTGNMIPRVFLRGIEISISILENKATSFEEVEEVLSVVDGLKLCLGIDSIRDVVSYSSECEIFVESGRLPRCPPCSKERIEECNKKRYLETEPFMSSPSRPLKKKQSTVK